jgi:hypothetical protein
VGGASLLAGRIIAVPASWRLLLGAAVSWTLATLSLGAPAAVLYALVTWLAGLGLVRRVVSGASPAGSIDPLLLVAPATLGLLAVAAANHGAFRRHTRLSKAVLALSGLALAGALNPLQGSLLAGLAGLLFMLVPMLAFWVGRALPDRQMSRTLVLVALLALPAASYGLAQTFAGFPPWDAEWIRTSGYMALSVGGVTRPFGSFSNAAEYGFFLGIGLVAWLSFGLRPGRLPVTAGALVLIGVAAVYVASRSIVVLIVVALCLMAAARGRVPFPAGPVLGLLLFGVLILTLPRRIPSLPQGRPGADLVAHQLRGLSEPLDPEASTLALHLRGSAAGMRLALSNPIGYGPGAVSMAGYKFGGFVFGTEADPSNVAVALGLPGLAAYLVLVVEGFRRAYGLAVRRRQSLDVCMLGILSVTFLQWLNGAQYAVAPLPWLVLGWVDARAWDEPRESTALDGTAVNGNGSLVGRRRGVTGNPAGADSAQRDHGPLTRMLDRRRR